MAALFSAGVDNERAAADDCDDILTEVGVRYFNILGIGPSPVNRNVKEKSDQCCNDLLSITKEGCPTP
jgi:hypothetical protein